MPEPLEETKLNLDFLRYLTTLNTGAIVLLASFLEKNFPNPEWDRLVIWVFVGFAVCTVTAALAQFLIIAEIGTKARSSIPTLALIGCAIFSFLVGTVTLTGFALKNFSVHRPPAPVIQARPETSDPFVPNFVFRNPSCVLIATVIQCDFYLRESVQ